MNPKIRQVQEDLKIQYASTFFHSDKIKGMLISRPKLKLFYLSFDAVLRYAQKSFHGNILIGVKCFCSKTDIFYQSHVFGNIIYGL